MADATFAPYTHFHKGTIMLNDGVRYQFTDDFVTKRTFEETKPFLRVLTNQGLGMDEEDESALAAELKSAQTDIAAQGVRITTLESGLIAQSVETASFTTTDADHGKHIKFGTGSSAAEAELHADAAIGTKITFEAVSSGDLTFAVEAGGTLTSLSSYVLMAGVGAVVTAICTANDDEASAEWTLYGDLVTGP